MRFSTRTGLVSVALALVGSWAEARRGGIVGGSCVGCHDLGEASLSLTSTPSSFGPGDQVTMTLGMTAAGASVAGVYVDCEGQGTLATVPGEGLALAGPGLVHTAPKTLSQGSVSFDFLWTAPEIPGALRCLVYAVLGNGDGRSSGDIATEDAFDFLFGCEGAAYYRDLDGDGTGVTEQMRTACVDMAPAGWAATPGDCNDNQQQTFPGAIEYCNGRDDNCNGEIDEDSVPIEQYPDADGDGYYSAQEAASGDVYVGCLLTGYAAEGGDCRPDDPTIHPGAEEVCNLYDDDCDGRIDYQVRPQCGEGRCRRESGTCELETCIAGAPLPETCNLLDDDCDGTVDNGILCDAGLTCIAGQCRLPDLTSPTMGGATGASSGGLPGTTSGLGGSTAASGGVTGTSTSSGGTVNPASTGASANPGGNMAAEASTAADSDGCALTPKSLPSGPPRGPGLVCFLSLGAAYRRRTDNKSRSRRRNGGRLRPS